MKKLNVFTLIIAKLSKKPIVCFDTEVIDFYGFKRLYHAKKYYLAANDTTKDEIEAVERRMYQKLYEKWGGLQYPDISISGNVPALNH